MFKPKNCNRLNAEADIIIQFSSIKIDINEICKSVKHTSHQNL